MTEVRVRSGARVLGLVLLVAGCAKAHGGPQVVSVLGPDGAPGGHALEMGLTEEQLGLLVGPDAIRPCLEALPSERENCTVTLLDGCLVLSLGRGRQRVTFYATECRSSLRNESWLVPVGDGRARRVPLDADAIGRPASDPPGPEEAARPRAPRDATPPPR